MNLQVNLVLAQASATDPDSFVRILHIDVPHAQVVTIDVLQRQALPRWQALDALEQAVGAGAWRIAEHDPRGRFQGLEETLPENYRAQRDQAWAVIQNLVLEENGQPRPAIWVRQQRGPLVTAAAHAHGLTRQTIYGYLRKYWQGGQTKNALLPAYDRCGNRGQVRETGAHKLGRPSASARVNAEAQGVVIDAEIKKRFQRGIKLFYENPQRWPLTKAFQRTLQTCFNTGYELREGVWVPQLPPASELPTFRQFQYWYARYGGQHSAQASQARLTERRYQLSQRPILGDATQMAFGPGSIFQIDATLADVYLVSALDASRIIGRPVLYTVVDVFSHMVVGFSVSLEGPSWLGALLALENATADKVAFCRDYGITITPDEWPTHYLPQEILADRGEMEGVQADQVVNGLGVRLSNTAPYRAEWKAIVERNFRLVNDQLIHWVPGAVYLPRERGGPDYRLEACLTLAQLRSLLIRQFLFHNRFHELKAYRRDVAMMRDQVEPYPLDLWQWGLQNRGGQLRHMDSELVRLQLLPTAEAAVTAQGLLFQQRQYDCPRAHTEQWYVRARANGRWKIPVAYDPRRLDVIYLRQAQPPRLEPCQLHVNDKAFLGCDWYEVWDQAELARQKEPARRTSHQQATATLDAQVAAIVEPAEQIAQAARQGQSPRHLLQGIRENRAQERELERQAAPAPRASTPAVQAPPSAEAAPPLAYIPPPRNIAFLRALDEERRNHD